MLVFDTLQRVRARQIQRNLDLQAWQLRVKAAATNLERAELSRASWSGWRKFEVRKKVIENHGGDICSFYFYPHDRKKLPPFKPGQFLMFRVDLPDPERPGERVEETRCYSLSDSPNSRYYRITVRKIAGTSGAPDGRVSTFFHDHIHEGDLIDVQAPSGDFYLDTEHESPVVLIAGGVGVTPILSMCNALLDQKSSREVWIFFGVRNPDDVVMLPNFEHAAGHLKNAHVHLCFSGALPAGITDVAIAESGIVYHKGRVDIDLLKQVLPGNNYRYFICGPEGMMTSLDADLRSWGVSGDKVHWEAFGESDVAPDFSSSASELRITYGATGHSIPWRGEKSIRAAARANKHREKKVQYACGQGKCGCCLTALKSGEVAYPGIQPAFGGLQEGYCLPCIAVPKTPIELDA